ncbi:neuritin 1-like a [Osmerus mordax]|uniref:neuritin 1-like a n=1 Tax=Osmerus mordax TaxID=8014 RepID=UPI00350ED274
MTSFVNYACLLLPVAFLLMFPLPSATFSSRKCGSIYKGFAQCLMTLGDSLSESTHKDHDAHEIHSICRSWDEFHDCANLAMAGCPEEAASVWESLRQESKKMQFSGNLYDMCSNRNQPQVNAQAPPNGEDANQESLRAHAHTSGHVFYLLPWLFVMLLVPWI